MCLQDSGHCSRVQGQLYHLTLPDRSPVPLDIRPPGRPSAAECLCNGNHAERHPPPPHLSAPSPPPPPPISLAARQVFAIPEILDLILQHARNDVRTLLTFVSVDSTSRSWARSILQKPSSYQPLRELVVETISCHKLSCLRRILSILIRQDVHPAEWSRLADQDEPEDVALLSTRARDQWLTLFPTANNLFERVFPRLPAGREIQKAIVGNADLSRAAFEMLRDIPRLYPSTAYDIDKDVFYSLACRQVDTLEHARLLLVRDRASPERAYVKTGRSPFADFLTACDSRYPSWSSASQHFLPLDLTWLFVRGYRLRSEDVAAMRHTGSTEIWEGMTRLAVACNRVEEEELLLEDASAFEAVRAAQIRAEEKKACDAQRREGSMWSSVAWEKHMRAMRGHERHRSIASIDELRAKTRTKADAFQRRRLSLAAIASEDAPDRAAERKSPKPPRPLESGTPKRRSSLTNATGDLLSRATDVSKRWKTLIPIGMPERALIESGGLQY